MAEFSNGVVQTVAANASALFTEQAVGNGGACCCSNGPIMHREGSGLFTLRGYGKYVVSFGANLAVPTGGTAGPISVAIAIDGEPIYSSIATVTPAAVDEYNNVHSSAIVYVPCGCCVSVSVRNVGTQAINIANPNLVIERV